MKDAQTKKSGLLIVFFILVIVLVLAGCTNAVNVQTKSAKARLAVAGARGSAPSINQTAPAPEPAIRYELTESTGNATCDNILKSIYPMVNVAIAEEEKQEKLLLEVLGEVEKAQDELEAGQKTKDELVITRANITYQQVFVRFQQINGEAKKAREDVKQQKAVLANAKKSCTGVNFEGTTQGDPLANNARNNATQGANNAEENETPECRALRNAERQLDNARRDRNAKENTLQRLENDKEEKENEKSDEEGKANKDDEKIARLQSEIEKLDEDIAGTQEDITKRTEDIDRFKAVVKEQKTKCQGGTGNTTSTNSNSAGSGNQTSRNNNQNNATRSCTSPAIREVESELADLRSDLTDLEEEKTQKEEELERAEDEDEDEDIERLEEELDDLEVRIDDKKDEIDDLERDLRDLREDC